MRFEVFQRAMFSPEHFAGQWYFRIRSGNGQIVAQSEGYTRKADAKRAAKALERAFNGRILPVKVIE